MTDQSKKNMRDFTIKMVLSFSLAISIFINILSHQANSLLKEEKKHLEAVNTIITYEATKLYKSYEKLLELKKIEEESRRGLEA